MKNNRFTLLSLSLILFVCMTGCGTLQTPPTATPVPTTVPVPTETPVPTLTPMPTNTPTNTPVPIMLYIGTNPDVSFDVTSSNVENLKITVPFGKNETCTIGPLEDLFVASDGSFFYTFKIQSDTSKPDIYITGKISGDSAEGNYSLDICEISGVVPTPLPAPSGIYTWSFTPVYSGSWSAVYSN